MLWHLYNVKVVISKPWLRIHNIQDDFVKDIFFYESSGNKFDTLVANNSVTMFQLVFEATMTGSYLGDIAIDDISVSDGRCGSDSVTPVSLHSNVTLERSAQLRRLQKFKKFRNMLRRRRNDDDDRS